MKKKFNFGVIRPFLRDEQHLIRYYANEHENTLPMLSRSHYKLNHSDTMTVASVVLRGMILNGWTCQQTYAWWQDYRCHIADTWGTCSRHVLCGPKIFQRVWTEIAQLLPAYQERMKEFPTQWFYMNIIDWTGTPRNGSLTVQMSPVLCIITICTVAQIISIRNIVLYILSLGMVRNLSIHVVFHYLKLHNYGNQSLCYY